MRTTLLIGVALVAAAAATARADGRVVRFGWVPADRAVAANAATPSQRALLVWDDGVETLAIETSFTGPGREFAWIVPLPAVPEIASSTPGLFPTLEALAAPEIVHDVPPLWVFCLLFGSGAAIAARLRGDRAFVGAILMAAGALHLAWIVSPAGEPHDPHSKSVLTLGGGADGRGAADAGAVTVHDRRVVGTLDTATVSSPDAHALMTWLAANGFAAEPAIEPVVAQYAAEGWVFAATKLRRDDDADARIQPLAFTFRTPSPVYPMRLTGVGNGDCRVELFVASDRRAAADGFDADWCGTLPSARGGRLDPHDGEFHPELKRLLGRERVVTLLSRTFDEDAMRRDVDVGWEQTSRDLRRKRFSSYGALVASADVAGVVALLLAAIAWSMESGARRRGNPRPTSPWTRWSWAWIAALAFAGTWLSLPVVPTHVLPPRPGATQFALPRRDAGRPATVDAARAWAAEHARGVGNPYTGGPVREEDSPGNYVIRAGTSGPEIRWFGAGGDLRSATD